MKKNRTRTTISLKPEVYEVFRRMAEVSGGSVSCCMGDWLESTVDGAKHITDKLEGVHRERQAVMKEAALKIAGINEETKVH